MSSKRITIVLGVLVIGFFGSLAYMDAVRTWQNLQEQATQIEELKTQSNELDEQLEKTIETQEQSQEELDKLEQEKKELEEEQKRLEAELQAKVERERRLAEASQQVINTATLTQTASASSVPAPQGNCGDNAYAAYIYGKESGGTIPGNCDTTATNAGGCYGIGQACPSANEVRQQCGADYACQNAWFTNYMKGRYGTWQKAYEFHVANNWW